MIEASDDQLMAAVCKGDTKAYSLLLERHGGAVFGMLLRLFGGNRTQAEDATQEIWMKVLEKCESYEPRGHFRAWLMTIARNQAFGEFRRSARFSDAPDGVEELAEDPFRVEDHLSGSAERERLIRAVDSLPDKQRAALVLLLDGEYSYEDIGTALGESLANVKNLIHRAKASLRKKLGDK